MVMRKKESTGDYFHRHSQAKEEGKKGNASHCLWYFTAGSNNAWVGQT